MMLCLIGGMVHHALICITVRFKFFLVGILFLMVCLVACVDSLYYRLLVSVPGSD